jgi:hypothetical protein
MCGEKGAHLHCWWECKLVHPLQKTVWRLLKKLEIDLPYIQHYHPKDTLKEYKSGYNKGLCTSMFLKHYSQIADEWIKKIVVFLQSVILPGNVRMKFCHSQVNGWNWRTSS